MASSTRTERLYRTYLALLGAAAAVAVVGAVFAAWAAGNSTAATTVAPTNTVGAAHLGHDAGRSGPEDDPWAVDGNRADPVQLPLVPLQGPRSFRRVRLHQGSRTRVTTPTPFGRPTPASR